MKLFLRKFIAAGLAAVIAAGLTPAGEEKTVFAEESEAASATVCGDFTVTTENDGFSYSNNTLSISGSGSYTIGMAPGVTETAADIISITSYGSLEVTIDNLNITSSTNSPITIVNGDAKLLLKGNNTLTSTSSGSGLGINSCGMYVNLYSSCPLTIESYNGVDADGCLTAKGSYRGAGIGVYDETDEIIINSGTITAYGGTESSDVGGAGIGGYSGASGGGLTINGGIITAAGGTCSAGIGGGLGCKGRNITINGGTVTATGGSNGSRGGAGIGCGVVTTSGEDGLSCANLTINGGSITATGIDGGAGIGGGYNTAARDITINGGTVNATGGSGGAGIGGGYSSEGSYITINGGDVTANGGSYAAGIGNGGSELTDDLSNTNSLWSEYIEINGGTVNATGGSGGAGIGGGRYSSSKYTTINGGTVTAKSGSGGAGIGGGEAYQQCVGIGREIYITGGTVNATGVSGAGIGGGSGGWRKSGQAGVGAAIYISGGFVTVTNGIGSGSGSCGYITVSGGYIICDTLGSGYEDDDTYLSRITVSGGYFADASADDRTACGKSIADSCSIVDNLDTQTNSKYPYLVFNSDVRAFAISGTNSSGSTIAENTDYTYSDNVLTVTSGGTYSIAMNRAEGISATQTERIAVKADNSKNLTITITDIKILSGEDAPFRADSGNLTLILDGDNYLTSLHADYEALSKTSSSNTLKITSVDGDGETSGSLTAKASNYGAGIGGGNGSPGINIEIAGGTVTAEGIYSGAGIGGGAGAIGSNITISGGVVTATGGSNGAAGIGGGYYSDGENITITGGTVTATGGKQSVSNGAGAGIGGGSDCSGKNITITGGTVTATGKGNASGIGGGRNGSGTGITITGGTVTAESLVGGSGIGNSGIKITGGTITAISSSASGIGGGDNVEITGGVINAEGTAGINGGSIVKISGGEITASGSFGAGISGSSITITDGKINAEGCFGAGIGGGGAGSSEVAISGGNIKAVGTLGGAGIGGGYGGSGTVTVTGGFITAASTTESNKGAGIGGGYQAGGIVTITGGTAAAEGYVSAGSGAGCTETPVAAVIDGVSFKAPDGFNTTPLNSDGEYVYLYEIPDTTEGETITSGGKTIIKSVVHHSDDDASQYIYLPLDSACAVSDTAVYILSYTEDDEGTVTTSVEKADKTYEIPDAAALSEFAKIVNSGGNMINGVVTANIDFSAYSDMIGSKTYPYCGTFDGGGYTIKIGYNITSGKRYIGLVGCSDGGTVQNLTVEGFIDFTNAPDPGTDNEDNKPGYSQVGGVVGFMTNGTISNVVSNVNITSSEKYQLHLTGGIVGSLYDKSTVDSCIYGGTLKAYKSYDALGGIVGYTRQSCSITNCANLGELSSTTGTNYETGDPTAPYLGGIIGYINHSTFGGLQNCYNYGNVSADDTEFCGAVVGWLRNSSDNLTNNYWLDSSAENAYGTNYTSFTAPEASTAADFSGGKVTYSLNSGDTVWYQNLDNGEAADSFPVLDSSHGTVYIADVKYCPGLTAASGGFSNTEGSTITGEGGSLTDHTYENGVCIFCGDEDSLSFLETDESGRYIISDGEKLAKFAAAVNKGSSSVNGIVTNNIDFTAYTDTVIGTEEYPYTGTFDGGGYTITLNIIVTSTSGDDPAALFAYASRTAVIKNLNTDGTITTSNKYAAGIAGLSRGSGGVTISHCSSTADIISAYSGDSTMGGILAVGEGKGGDKIDNCFFAGSISGENAYSVGGIAGWLRYEDSSVTNCYTAAKFNIASDNDSDTSENITRYFSSITVDTSSCYYLNPVKASSTQGTAKTAAEFESGEVTWLLNGGSGDSPVWYQTLGTDSYPVFVGDTVYSTVFGYSNNENLGDIWVDGVIDEKDSAALLKYLSGIPTAENVSIDVSRAAADVNGDGSVNILDSTTILKCLGNN